jgi:prepilin-type N-terminal cleavage/methylation domain-containing protein
MKPRIRNAFTLVELLVVITIIGMLVALLLPAVNNAREAGRQATCQNNQRNFGQAIQQFVTAKDYFPGYRERFSITSGAPSGTQMVVGWQVMLLPYLGKTDIVDAMKASSLATLPYLDISICPSDNTVAGKTAPSTSYIANCGRLDNIVVVSGAVAVNVADYSPAVAESLANGIFQDRVVNWPNPKVQINDIKDGQATTLMLSENVDAAYYTDGPGSDTPLIVGLSTDTPATWKGKLDSAHNCTERGAGFVWWDTSGGSGTPPPAPTSSAPPYPAAGINGGHGDYDPFRLGWPSPPYTLTPAPTVPPTAQSNYAARPSSYHPGGVVVTFAGGNVKFLRDDIDYPVYCLLMTPNGAKSPTKSNDGASPPKSWQFYHPLTDGQF